MTTARVLGLVAAAVLSGCANRHAPVGATTNASDHAGAAAPALENNAAATTTDEAPLDPGVLGRTEAEVVAQLDRAWPALCGERPLGQLQADMQSTLGFNVELDNEDLERISVTPQLRLGVPTEPEAFGEALGNVLSAVGAELAYRDGGLLVTTKENASDILTTRRYDLSGMDLSSLEGLAAQIEEAAAGALWQTIDGIGGSQEFQPATGELIIRQTFAAQERIRRFLKKRGGSVLFTSDAREDRTGTP